MINELPLIFLLSIVVTVAIGIICDLRGIREPVLYYVLGIIPGFVMFLYSLFILIP